LFSNPVSVAIEPEGSLVVADFDTDLLRRVSANGTISTLTNQSTFQRPFGLAFLGSAFYSQTDADPNGDRGSTTGTLWRIDRSSGVATVAAADIGRPRGFAALSDGRLVLSDFANQRVGIIDLTTGVVTDLAGLSGCPGSANGAGAWARFLNPQGVAVLAENRIIVADREAHLLREVSLTGVVTTFAGDGVAGTIDGARASARFVAPQALAADNTGAILVSDTGALPATVQSAQSRAMALRASPTAAARPRRSSDKKVSRSARTERPSTLPTEPGAARRPFPTTACERSR
jgi:hypothetical protein